MWSQTQCMGLDSAHGPGSSEYPSRVGFGVLGHTWHATIGPAHGVGLGAVGWSGGLGTGLAP